MFFYPKSFGLGGKKTHCFNVIPTLHSIQQVWFTQPLTHHTWPLTANHFRAFSGLAREIWQQINNLSFLVDTSKDPGVPTMPLVKAAAQTQSLAWKLPYGTGTAAKLKKMCSLTQSFNFWECTQKVLVSDKNQKLKDLFITISFIKVKERKSNLKYLIKEIITQIMEHIYYCITLLATQLLKVF